MWRAILAVGAVMLIVIVSQWNTLQVEANLKSMGEWLGPVLYPFYLSRSEGQ